MKKFQKVFCVLLAVFAAAMMLTACPAPVKDNGEYILVKVGGNGGVETSQSVLGGLLDELSGKGELHVKLAADTGFGRWLEEIGTLIPDSSSNEYIALYATTDDMNHTDPLSKKTVDGVTYYATLKGVDTMPVIDGVTYLFILETF